VALKVGPSDAVCGVKLGSLSSSGQWGLVDDKDVSQGVRVALPTGVACPGKKGFDYQLVLHLYCDANALQPNLYEVVDDEQQCAFVFNLKTRQSCPSFKTMSGFSIFIVCTLIALLIYCAVGIVFKTITLGTSGVESIPHVDFWRSVPRRVSVTCSVVLGEVRQRMGKGTGAARGNNDQFSNISYNKSNFNDGAMNDRLVHADAL
jgi:hypothetical protein